MIRTKNVFQQDFLMLLMIYLILFSACQLELATVYDKDGRLKKAIVTIQSPKEMVQTWNDAINGRRWDVLNTIYAEEIYYYTNKIKRQACLKRKIKAIEKAENFQQAIYDIKIVQTYYKTYEAYFYKVFSDGKQQDTILAFLSMIKDAQDRWHITQESDFVTSRNQSHKICSCSDFWTALYNGGSAGYYLLSEVFDDALFYVGKDGYYYLEVTYDMENHEISFRDREDRTTHLATFDFEIFELKTGRIKNDLEEYLDKKYDQRFFRRLKEFCQ